MTASPNNAPEAAMLIQRSLDAFVKKQAVTLTASGRPLSHGQPVTEAQLLDMLRLFAIDVSRAIKATNNILVGFNDFVAGWNLYKPRLIEQQLKDLRTRVSYNEQVARAGRTSLEQWMHGVLFRPPTDVERAVMLHFLWQVKRKLFGKPTYYHMMPVYVSAQGTGKTTAIQMLVEPLREVVSNTTLEQFTDQRSWATLSRTYIKVVDEMAKAERTDMATLKMALSAEGVLEYRPMRSNDLEQVIQNNTFIGTSNEEISGLIRDYTGVRRFFQIIGCMKPVHELDPKDKERHWQMLKTADMLAIWRSVDEELSILPEFREHQLAIAEIQVEELQSRSSFDEFWDMPGYGFEWANKETGKKFTGREVYDAYAVFCEHHGLDDTYSALRITRQLKLAAPQMSKVETKCRHAQFYLRKLSSSDLSGNKLSLLKNEATSQRKSED